MKAAFRSRLGILALLSLLITTVLLTALVPSTETKLIPTDVADFGWFQEFGYAVAIDGDTAVIGAPIDSQAASSAGAAYVFVREDSSWVQQAKLIATDAAAGAEFGHAVAISGDTVVAGAHLDSAAGVNSGAVYVFTRSGTTWTAQAKLSPTDAASNKQFGGAVAIEGDTVAVGAITDSQVQINAGAVYVFSRSRTAWSQQAKLFSSLPRPGNLFGFSVALSGGTLAVGSPFDEDLGVVDAGAVYVFTGSGSSWAQQAELTASDAHQNALLGWSVAVSGDTILAGAPQDQSAVALAGSAHVFVRSGGTWSEEAKLVADDGAMFDSFGYSVALDGNTAVVGSVQDNSFAPFAGSAYTFARSGTAWSQSAEFSATDILEGDEFGYAVAIDGGTILVGAAFSGGLDEGAAYLYSSSNTAPVADAQSITTSEDTAATLTLTGSDADGDALTFTVLSAPAKGALSGTAPNLTYTPNLNASGADSFTFKVNDGALDSATATVSITVAPVNDAPVANAQTVTTLEDTAARITLTGSDVENDALTFTVLTAPTKGTLSGTVPNLTYTPKSNENGLDRLTFRVDDGALDSAAVTVSIAITPVNDGPNISDIRDQAAVENSATAPIAFVVGDIDNDATTLIVSAASDNAALVPATAFTFVGSGADRTLIVTPALNKFGTATISVTVSDGVAAASDSFVLTVTPLNHPPVADASASPARVISPNNMNALATLDGSRSSDPDRDVLTYTWFANGNMTTPIGTGITGSVKLAVGTHQIALVVNDGRATDVDDVTVEVIKLSQAIKEIIAFVEGTDISRNLKKDIIHSLTDAARDCDREKFRSALEELRSLNRKIESLAPRKIDRAVAEALTAQIQVVIDVLKSR